MKDNVFKAYTSQGCRYSIAYQALVLNVAKLVSISDIIYVSPCFQEFFLIKEPGVTHNNLWV